MQIHPALAFFQHKIGALSVRNKLADSFVLVGLWFGQDAAVFYLRWSSRKRSLKDSISPIFPIDMHRLARPQWLHAFIANPRKWPNQPKKCQLKMPGNRERIAFIEVMITEVRKPRHDPSFNVCDTERGPLFERNGHFPRLRELCHSIGWFIWYR